MSPYKVAVSGLGFIGVAHIEALRRIPNVEVTLVHGRDIDKTKQKARELGIPGFTNQFDELLASDVDTVHICTPNYLHYDQVKKVLRAGKHILCEKPLTIDLNEAKELVNLADQNELKHAVHFNIRFYPMVRQMKIMREKGDLGDVTMVLGSYLQDWLFHATDYNWRLEPKKSGTSRAVADIGSHLMDLIEYITGLRISEVMADFNTIHKTRKKPLKNIETFAGKVLKPEDYKEVDINTEDQANILLRFNNGSKGCISVNQTVAGRKNQLSLEIGGSKETYAWNSEEPNELWVGRRDEMNRQLLRDPSLFYEESQRLISYPGGHNEGFADTIKQFFKEFYRDLDGSDSGTPPDYPNFYDGMREVLLVEKIMESNEQQSWIKVE